MKTACVILAAGLGKRMRSSLPKVLHRTCGITMIESVARAAAELRPEKIIVVAGKHIDEIRESLTSRDLAFALQDPPKGTAHALHCARQALGGFQGCVVVLNGDTPLLCPDTIKNFIRLHRKGKNHLSVLSFTASDPSQYGRIVRDGSGRFLAIVEDRDAGPLQKRIHEVNSGVYALNHDILPLLDTVKMNRAKGEYYLTDIVAAASGKGLKAAAFNIGKEEEFMGVNTREELRRASLLMRKNIIQMWGRKGVDFLDPGSVFVHADVLIGRDTTVYPNVCLEGRTKIGSGSTIYPNVRITDGDVGRGVTIKDSTVIEGSRIRDRASVGPFAHIRPGSDIGVGVKVGNFVELKKASLGKASKASHLSYLGDTTIGKEVNIGAGTITCNYDGEKKHLTVIGDHVFIGSDSQLVAPVTVGKGAYVGAGSTITKDVPAGALAVSRADQKTIRDWAVRRRKRSRRRITGSASRPGSGRGQD